MTTLREAAQLAVTMLRTGMPEYDACDVLEVLEAALEQPEQEPVAIVSSVTEPGQYGVKVRWLGGFPQIAMKLYTHPPRREWRGLDRDETMHLMNDTAENYWADEAHIQRFARAVEAALKERNI